MIQFSSAFYEIVVWIFLIYSFAILGIYSWIAIYAYGALNKYRNKNLFTDYNLIVANPNAPRFSLVAPAYNEGMTIVENVRSLLSLYYNNLEIIIVNDGSKDNSIAQLIEAYQLDVTSFFVQGTLETKAIKAIYRSKNPAFKKLLVVDKQNGGKADALNVGINVSSGDYVVCIDVDCILEQDAILKLAKPFLEQTDKRVIACGGVIRLANNCQVSNGKITDVNLPTSWLGRSQALEYIRAFVLGRMAWSRASGLILISGAFGAFDKDIVLACGGYDSKTVGEDMELVVRMRRYMEEQKLPYEVVNIPDPLCWTEVPESKEILKRQRNRWMRGTIETLWKHRKMMFNPAYGKLGMVSLPYWFFFELLGPVIEYIGYIVFIIFFMLGIINWQFFFALFALVVASGILYSIYAILVDLMSHQVYTKRKDLSKLVATAVLEPFYFHPIVVKAGVHGVLDYFRNQHGWGEMTRQGFAKKDENLSFPKRIVEGLKSAITEFTWPAATFMCLLVMTSMIESVWYYFKLEGLQENTLAFHLLFNNIDFGLQSLVVCFIIYTIIRFLNPHRASTRLAMTLGSFIVIQFLLFLYYAESRNLLGSDLFIYSQSELLHILQTSGMLNITAIACVGILIFLVIRPLQVASKKLTSPVWPGSAMLILGLIAFGVQPNNWFIHQKEAIENATSSKWAYFFNSNAQHIYEVNEDALPAWITNKPVENIDPNFPFLRDETTPDFLSSYFHTSTTPPNLVLLIVEGLGREYSSEHGYIGNFAPFLNSLAKKSLYWEYALSSSGRTFATLPTLTGSLPFAQSGFLELPKIPNNFNLFNVLNKNNFTTTFLYGGNAEFDNMKSFVLSNENAKVIDEKDFSSTYKKLPGNNGDSWGYEDQALFSKLLETPVSTSKPYFNVALTLSTHNPFMINNAAFFENRFDTYLKTAKLSSTQLEWAKSSRKALVSLINFDHAFEQFMKEYAKRPDYQNTIFVITGDHSMPEIPFQEKIDRYQVPLIIHSPLLKTAKAFKNPVSHFDLAPSILAMYRETYKLDTPKKVTWVGHGLGASNNTGYPLMQTKSQIIDYIYKNYHFVDGALYEFNTTLNENLSNNTSTKQHVENLFQTYKIKNKIFIHKQQLLPDSIYTQFIP